jgi:hypothetical protein
MDEMKALSSPVAELALWPAEAGSVAGAGTTIKSEGTKPKVLPIQDCLSSERGRLSLFRKSKGDALRELADQEPGTRNDEAGDSQRGTEGPVNPLSRQERH